MRQTDSTSSREWERQTPLPSESEKDTTPFGELIFFSLARILVDMLELSALGKDLFTSACKFQNWVWSQYLSPHAMPTACTVPENELGIARSVSETPGCLSISQLFLRVSLTFTFYHFCLTSVIWKIKPDSFYNTWTIIFETNIYFHFVCIFPPKSNLLFSQRLSFLHVVVVLIVSWLGLSHSGNQR